MFNRLARRLILSEKESLLMVLLGLWEKRIATVIANNKAA